MADNAHGIKGRDRNIGLSIISLGTGVVALISLIANYLQFEQAGLANVFWLLLALAAFFALLGLFALAISWWRSKQARIKMKNELFARQAKIAALLELRDDIRDCENARLLSGVVGTRRPKIVSLRRQEGAVKAILNIGKRENLTIGTRLLVYRIDSQASEGFLVEQPIGLLRVSHVQSGNNLSHADVIDTRGQTFWLDAQKQLRKAHNVDPPRNFILPYVLPDLAELSLDELATIRKSLNLIIRQYTGVDQPVTEQEDIE